LAESPSPPSRPADFPWLPFLLGAAAGGLVAATFGGIAGALLGWLGATMLRRPWSPLLRWLAALAVWSLGWAFLWIGGGYVRVVQGLLRGLGQ
jgi:hypothetical protein